MKTNVTTFHELVLLLGNRQSRKVGNNTYVENLGDGVIGVRLHSTHVVIFSDHRLVLNTNGWRTVTTKDRINVYLPGGWFVEQKDYYWYLCQHIRVGDGDAVRRVPFYDGVTIDTNENRVLDREEVRA